MRRLRTTSWLGLLGLFLLLSLASMGQDFALFEQLQSRNGKAYAGKMTFPDTPNDPMNKPMRIEIVRVSETHIRVPFMVGDDASRTWLLSKLGDAVELKHDHRHPDGTPDDVTNYGGVDPHPRLGAQLIFVADEETAALLPEAKGNVWSLRLSPDGQTLTYYLERDGKPRFEAVFDLSKEL